MRFKSNIISKLFNNKMTVTINSSKYFLPPFPWFRALNELSWSFFSISRSFVSYTMMVIVVNFIVPLTVMFYCYYHVTQSMRLYAARNCTAYLNRDWADQADVTKVRSQNPWTVLGNKALTLHSWKVLGPLPGPFPLSVVLLPSSLCSCLSLIVKYYAYLFLGCLCVLWSLGCIL